MNRNIKIRLLQYFFLIASVLGLLFLPLFWILLGLFAYTILETLAGNIGLHRYYCHNSFQTNKFWETILRFLSHYIGVGSVITWVGQHRHHHKHSDTKDDVHNYRDLGILKVLFGVWEVNIERKLVKDVIKDKKLLWWHKNYWNLHISLIILWSLIDLMFNTYFLFALYALPNLMCLISGYVLAITTHSHGYKTYDLGSDQATNSWIANIYTLGEGWHNNHHAKPGQMRQGELWWEWDLPAFVIERFLRNDDRTK